MNNPNSVLAKVPQGKFTSRYADPNNPAASGSLISLVSGGHLVPNPESRGLVGGIASVVGQAVRGERQGSGWDQVKGTNGQGYNQQYGNLQNGNRYSRHYRGRSRRRYRNGSDRRDGLISTPIGLYKKLLKKVDSLPCASPALKILTRKREQKAQLIRLIECPVFDGCQHAFR